MFKVFLKSNKAFTLIELLVVVAIIGVLSTVVIASLNSARDKGKISAIKSNLKSLSSQAEIYWFNSGSYLNFNTSPEYVKINDAVVNLGGVLKYTTVSNGGSGYLYNNYQSYGITVKYSDTKYYSVGPNGIVSWATADASATGMSWSSANTACASQKGRLPTLEEIYTLRQHFTDTTYSSFGLTNNLYWSNAENPTNTSNAYYFMMSTGGFGGNATKSLSYFVRCVIP